MGRHRGWQSRGRDDPRSRRSFFSYSHLQHLLFHTGAWIITGGSHAGVMKHVGEAIRDFGGGENDSEIVLIGIATWGIVHNRKSLLSEAVRSIHILHNL